MRFKPTRANFNICIKDKKYHCEYNARYVGDMIIFSKDPITVMQELKETYIKKSFDKPMYYLKGDVVELGPELEKRRYLLSIFS